MNTTRPGLRSAGTRLRWPAGTVAPFGDGWHVAPRALRDRTQASPPRALARFLGLEPARR